MHVNKVNGIILSARWSYYIDGNYDGSGAQLIARSSDGPFTKYQKNTKEATFLYIYYQPPQQVSSPESFYFRAAEALAVFMTCQLLEKV